MLAACVLLVGGGCSYTFDEEKPAVTLIGTAPLTSSFQRLNRSAAGGSSIVEGVNNSPWVIFNEQSSLLRAVRLDGPPGEEVFDTTNLNLRFRAFYQLNAPTEPTRTLKIHTLGAPELDADFVFPPGPELLVINGGGYDDLFVYWVLDKSTTTFQILRRDKSRTRTIKIPMGIDPAKPGAQMTFTSDMSVLLVRWPSGKMTAYSVLEDRSIELGSIGANWYIDERNRQVLTIGAEGIRVVPLGGGPPLILETESTETDTLFFYAGYAYYRVGDELRRVSRDGAGPVILVKKGLERVLALLGTFPDNDIVFATTPTSMYSASAGDGWYGDWNFMERGRALSFSIDGRKMHFLEHAARTGGIGDLVSVQMPLDGPGAGDRAVLNRLHRIGGAPLHLARNVRQYDEISDGKLLVVENHAATGTYNRLVLIDEKTLTSRWVAQAAHQYRYIPGSTDLIVDTVSGATGYDILRVPLPR